MVLLSNEFFKLPMKFYLLLGLLINLLNFASVSAFFSAFAMSDASRSKKREIYDIPGNIFYTYFY